VKLLNESLRGCVSRMEKLAAAHRAESSSAHRPVLVVGHADTVHLGGGGIDHDALPGPGRSGVSR
jgi:hypothetical protein